MQPGDTYAHSILVLVAQFWRASRISGCPSSLTSRVRHMRKCSPCSAARSGTTSSCRVTSS